MPYSYHKQKVREALSCLVGNGNLDTKLCCAGIAVIQIPRNNLPRETHEELLIAVNAFTSFPGNPPEGRITKLIQLIPEQRKRELIEKVINFFETICELNAKYQRYEDLPEIPKDVSLKSPNKWEFLFWNLYSESSITLREEYINYAQHWLPNFPEEILTEWIGRHGKHALENWSHIDLENLIFTEVMFSNKELENIEALNDTFTEIGPESTGASHLNSDYPSWLVAYIKQNGTWPSPILVLDNPQTHRNEFGMEIRSGLVLMEGHSRLSLMLNYSESNKSDTHKVWLAKVITPTPSTPPAA